MFRISEVAVPVPGHWQCRKTCRWVYSFIIALPRPRSTMEISILIGSDIV